MGSDGVRVAAVLVAFNRDEFLKRALQKTYGQTRKCDTVIVVDNANLDSTRELVVAANTAAS